MTELLPAHHDDPDAPLRGVRVLEIEGEFTGYAGKLLADLGAEVMLLAPVSAEYGFDARRFFQHHTKSPVDEVTALSDLAGRFHQDFVAAAMSRTR